MLLYIKFGKRAADIGVSIIAIAILLPLIMIIAVILKLSNNGTVIFKQARVGRHATLFSLYKFRSMSSGESTGFLDNTGLRVTRVGKWLRRTKIDELPQLWNVLKGDMSLVGPRPETPDWVDTSNPVWNNVLSVKPGLTDFASLKYRNEEQLLAGSGNPKELYKHSILPDKLKLGAYYVENLSFRLDCQLFGATLASVLNVSKNGPLHDV